MERAQPRQMQLTHSQGVSNPPRLLKLTTLMSIHVADQSILRYLSTQGLHTFHTAACLMLALRLLTVHHVLTKKTFTLAGPPCICRCALCWVPLDTFHWCL